MTEHLTETERARRLAAAKKRLEPHHSTLKKLWGVQYVDNPRYHQAVHELAFTRRTPGTVLADYVTG